MLKTVMNVSDTIKEYSVAAGFGAVIYGLAEVLFRGHTHWTMAVTGGAAFLALYVINTRVPIGSVLLRCVIGCFVITAAEFAVGCVVNRWLGWAVWDYSHRPLNVLGQICPQFSAFWFGLSLPAYWLSELLHGQLSSIG